MNFDHLMNCMDDKIHGDKTEIIDVTTDSISEEAILKLYPRKPVISIHFIFCIYVVVFHHIEQ